jgi:uncharacterized protein (TIRG00374 family)
MKGHTDKAFQDFHEGMKAFYRPGLLIPVLLTILTYLSFFISCWMMCRGLEIQIGILYLTFCMAVVNIVSLLAFAGFGTREGALIILFGLEGFQKTQALAFSMVLLLVGTVLISALGLWAYTIRPVKFDSSSPIPPA